MPINGDIITETLQDIIFFRWKANHGFVQEGMSPPELASRTISRTRMTGHIAYASKVPIPTQAIGHSVSHVQPDPTAQRV